MSRVTSGGAQQAGVVGQNAAITALNDRLRVANFCPGASGTGGRYGIVS